MRNSSTKRARGGRATRNSRGNPESEADWSFHHYLPISDDLLHSGAYLIGAGRARIAPGEAYPPVQHPRLYNFGWTEGRTLPAFSVVFITGGRGIFEMANARRIIVEADSVIVLFPGIWHRYRPDVETGWTEKWIHFNGEFVHRLMDEGILSSARPVLRPAGFWNAEATMDRLLNATHRDPCSNSVFLSLQVLAVIAGINDDRPTPPMAPDAAEAARAPDAIVAAALQFIWTASFQVLSVSDVVRSVGVNRRTLERHMRTSRGHGILEEIVQCRFSRAEWLLRETELPIKTVVHLSGFGSVQNMRDVFLDRTRCAPGVYRYQSRTRSTDLRPPRGY